MSSTAAFFDLDKTVLAKSSTLAFGRPFYANGLIGKRAVVRSAYAQFMFARSGADADRMEKMRSYLADVCAGMDVALVRRTVDRALHTVIDPLVFDEALQLIRDHQRAGRTVVIVSSSGREVVAPVGAMLGVDRVIATDMVIVDGRYTGEIASYAYGHGKATAIRALAAAEGFDLGECFAYSDSITDLPMLEAVGHPTAVNPDRALRKSAAARGWPIVTFARAVPARTPLTGLKPGPTKVAAAVAITVAVTAIGAVLFTGRRSPLPQRRAIVR